MGLFNRKPKSDRPDVQGGSEPDFASVEEMMGVDGDTFVMAVCGGPAGDVELDTMDYSLASLVEVDSYLGAFHDAGEPLPENNAVAASAYLCETLRRTYGGRYLAGPDSDPYVLVVGEPHCQIGVMATSKVRGRVVNGAEDDICFFVDGLPGLLERQQDATLI